MKTKNICFSTLNCSPDTLGGYALYHKNLIKYINLNNKNIQINWVYFGKEDKIFTDKGVKYYELKTNKFKSFLQLGRHLQFAKFLNKQNFDIINTVGGLWTFFYKKKKGQTIVQTLHGTIYYFYKNNLKRFNPFLRIILSPILIISWVQDRLHKKTDKVICVSKKVKKQIENLHGKKENIVVIRTGVDLNIFKERNKKGVKESLNLDLNKVYGLYVGGGGYWTKGLDRAISLCKEIYNLDKNFRLLMIGSDYQKVKNLIDEEFVIFLENISREKMPLYYSASDIFFCMSRYEGGAPTLVVSEAMASKCLIVCSKDSEQEIVEDGKNAIIIKSFNKEAAKRIYNIYNNKKLKTEIINNSIKTIREISLEKWGKKYLEVLLK